MAMAAGVQEQIVAVLEASETDDEAIAREIEVEVIVVSDALRELEREGRVGRTASGTWTLQDPRHRDIHAGLAGILKRQEADGLPHISEGEMGRELKLEPTEVANHLREMERHGQVTRTGEDNWELTPATSMHTEPRPDPKEPRQG
jgi:Mn-dependent DtxR family transcriptional regulator